MTEPQPYTAAEVEQRAKGIDARAAQFWQTNGHRDPGTIVVPAEIRWLATVRAAWAVLAGEDK